MAVRAAAEGLTWRRLSCLRLQSVMAAVSRRGCSKVTTQQDKSHKRSKFRPVANSTHDWIGPPNPLSNLRPVIYHIPENESELEERLRTLRQDTEDWNHNFWTRQNLSFNKEKDAFIASLLKAKGVSERDEQGRRHAVSSEEMAVFYKSFLDKNRERHVIYNKEWYRRNFAITFLMARVTLRNLWRSVINKHKRSPTT